MKKTLLIQQTKHVQAAALANVVGCPLSAKKTRYGVELTKVSGNGFSDKEAIMLAEKLGLRYNGKVIL